MPRNPIEGSYPSPIRNWQKIGERRMVGHPPHFSNGDGLVPRRMNLDIEIDSQTDIYGTISAWWNKMMDGNKDWQKGVYLSLCACSVVLAIVGLVQLIRIQLRVADCGWTTQKVFHLMNFVVNGCRALLFGLYNKVSQIRPRTVQIMLVEIPGLFFFSTYTLLLLFWAEIYHQARCLPADYIRPTYYVVNGAVYLIEIMLWICLGLSKSTVALQAARVVLSVVSLIVALGFSIYGVRLFFILRSFPMESKGRQKKLHEVSYVAVVCCTCFLGRCAVAAISAFLDDDLSLEVDAMTQPLGDLLYYMTVEIVPSALVLFILRKLPPKRVSDEKQMQFQTEWD